VIPQDLDIFYENYNHVQLVAGQYRKLTGVEDPDEPFFLGNEGGPLKFLVDVPWQQQRNASIAGKYRTLAGVAGPPD
jgi:hypothetical protein